MCSGGGLVVDLTKEQRDEIAGSHRLVRQAFHDAEKAVRNHSSVEFIEIAHAHALANLQARDARPHRTHGADDLVTGHQRVRAEAPIVVDQVQITVAEAAMRDVELDICRPYFTGFIVVRTQWLFGGVRS